MHEYSFLYIHALIFPKIGRTAYHQPTIYPQIGSVTMDSNVLNTTHFVANCGSLSYRAAKMAAVEPAGIPVSRTATPVATESSPAILHNTNASAGNNTSRKILYLIVVALAMERMSTSDIILPMINIISAVLQFAMPPIVPVINSGNFT